MRYTMLKTIYSGNQVDRYTEADLLRVQGERCLRLAMFESMKAPAILIEEARRLVEDGKMRLGAYRRAKLNLN